MRRVFKASWPFLASLETLLLCAATMGAAHKFLVTQPAVRDLAGFEASQLGVSPSALTWGFIVFMLAGPCAAAMVVIDRLLVMRRGFAVLSVLAAAAWSGFAVLFAPDILRILPLGWRFDPRPLSFAAIAAMAAASAALLLHARALWIGLNDRGFTGLGLLGPGDPRLGLMRSDEPPRRGGASLAVSAVGVAVAVVALATALIHYGGGAATMDAPKPVRPVAIAPQKPVQQVATAAPQQQQSLVDTPLPAVRVPTSSNEASASRKPDGTFVFEAHVNDRPVAMMFDTGASSVAIRAEDAARLGISVGNLNYSLRTRTANGISEVAPVTIGHISVGSIIVTNVPAVVSRKGALQDNLLGQSFLARLKSYEVQSTRVTLHGW